MVDDEEARKVKREVIERILEPDEKRRGQSLLYLYEFLGQYISYSKSDREFRLMLTFLNIPMSRNICYTPDGSF